MSTDFEAKNAKLMREILNDGSAPLPFDILSLELQQEINSLVSSINNDSVNAFGVLRLTLEKISSLLLPLPEGRIASFDVVFRDLKVTMPLVLNFDTLRIRVIFENCTFSSIGKECPWKYKFVNCHLEHLHINIDVANMEFVNSNVRTVVFSMNSSHLVFEGGEVERFFGTVNLNYFFLFSVKLNHFDCSNTSQSYSAYCDVIFKAAPNFFGAKIDKSTIFYGCTFLDFGITSANYYRELRHILNSNGDEFGALQFSSLELQSKHDFLSRIKKFSLDWWVSLSYKHLNKFGFDTYRPLNFVAAQFVFSIGVFLIMAKYNLLYLAGHIGHDIGVYIQAILLAFSSSLGPLRILGSIQGLTPTTLAGELVFWAFNVSSTLLWFFLVLGIRKKYKLS